jgi:hypothetical protein
MMSPHDEYTDIEEELAAVTAERDRLRVECEAQTARIGALLSIIYEVEDHVEKCRPTLEYAEDGRFLLPKLHGKIRHTIEDPIVSRIYDEATAAVDALMAEREVTP